MLAGLLAATVSVSSAEPLLISEFIAKNTTGITDENGTRQDWIEIHNAGEETTSLGGWYLTDEASRLTKWQFPATNLAPGQFMVVWASDKNRRVAGAPLHTNFKLSDEGEYLALVQPDGNTVASEFSPKFPLQFPDVSFGQPVNTHSNYYLAWPTPGATNSPATNFVIAALKITPSSGWFNSAISVTITTATPGVTIYCTTNGSAPGPTNGFNYAGAIAVAHTTVLRAAAYRTGFSPTLPTAQTYIFLDQVIHQTGEGFPSDWGYTTAAYTLDPVIINDPQWSGAILEDLLSVPTLSVAMNIDDFFGTNGIYSNPQGDGVEWERPCSIEYMSRCRPGFQINCGIRLQGNSSRGATTKQSLRFLFKQIYGAGHLDYDLYPDSPVTRFETLTLKASFQDHWLAAGPTAQMQRDQWCSDTQREMGGYGFHGGYVHLYINGLYWGVYDLLERPDAAYAASYLGGEKSDYDAWNEGELLDGTDDSWNAMFEIVNAGITNDLAYTNLAHYLNLPAFIDYMLLNLYALNFDWPQVNWRAADSVSLGVPYQFFSWDAEYTLGLGGASGLGGGSVHADLTGVTSGAPAVIYTALREHPEFRQAFGDHAQRHLFNQGSLTPDECATRWMRRANEISAALIPEMARWGHPGTNSYTPNDWVAEQNRLLTEWFPQRTAIFIDQLRDAGLYPAVDAPVLTPSGGIISNTATILSMSAPSGTIYYTTNGGDPRLPGGLLSPDALVYTGGLTIADSVQVRARTFETNVWSALVEAKFVTADTQPLRIEGITRRCDDWIELKCMGWPGVRYAIESSTDLASWTVLTNLTANSAGSFRHNVNTSTNSSPSFYRLRWP